MNIRAIRADGSIDILQPTVELKDGVTVVSIKKEDVAPAEYVDFLYDYFTAREGDEGYFVLPFDCQNGVTACYFNHKADTEFVCDFSHIYCYGMKKGQGGIFGIITGCKYDYALVAGVKDGNYYAYPRFKTEGEIPEDDIVVEYHQLSVGDYNEMAAVYRKHQMEKEACRPLRERVDRDPRLARAADGMAVRVRQGWKPVPSPVENQTADTEPDMVVACDYQRVGQLVDEFKRQGVDKAEFCLVGWNRMGHDGRYPQIFPPEPKLGGEEKLRALISKTKALGYNIVGHTNASDAYTVSELWDESYLLRNRDGSFFKMDSWSSGRAYKICPRRMYELFGEDHNEKMAELGFEGIHYSDVITILAIKRCFDTDHPLTRKEGAMWYKKLMERARVNFGGFSSESGYDYAASSLDYAMYTSFHLDNKDMPAICDEQIPFWQLVYHGIILYNPGTYTLNYSAKKKENRLKFFEFGGRPLVCVYANFASDRNWMGLEDIRMDTDEEMRESVSKIKIMADDYEWLREVRFAFMDSHKKISDGVYEIAYSNGITLTVDYNLAKVTMQGEGVWKELTL